MATFLMGRSPDSDDDLGDDLGRMHRRRSEAAARGGRAYLRLLQLAETRDSGQARRIAGFLAATYDGAAPPPFDPAAWGYSVHPDNRAPCSNL